MSAKERRKYPRFLIQLKAHCYHVLSDGTSEKVAAKVTRLWGEDNTRPEGKGVARDISFGGMNLETVRAFREGTILLVELEIPRRATPNRARGSVKIVVIGLMRWIRSMRQDPPYRYALGIQFIYMQQAHWEVLQRCCQGLKPTGLEKKARKSKPRKKPRRLKA